MDVQAQFSSKEKLKQVQRLKYKNQQTKILLLWEDYVANKLDGEQLLGEISKIYKPCTQI